MFSSWSPIAALVDGVKIGSGSRLRLDEARRQLDAADRAGLLVVLAPRAGEVAAHDGLHRQRLGLVHHDRAAGEVLALGVGAERLRVDEVVGDDGARSCSNQKLAICVSTTPLSGIGVGRMTSKAESRSLVTMSISLGAYS